MRVIGAALAFATLAGCVSPQVEPPAAYRFDNGRWFDGASFRPATVFVRDGRLQLRPAQSSGAAIRVVDLKGGYVVPPYCEAHNHNLGFAKDNDYVIYRYLADGVFYVKTLSNLPRLTEPVRYTYNRPDSVDTVFPGGPITASGGHPVPLRERLLGYGLYPGFTKETLKDQGYYVVDTAADLDRVWAVLRAHRPDFVKVVLSWSEEFEKRRADPKFDGRKGLDPKLLPVVVQRAHAEGLKVSVHVNSAHDFGVALRAGADEIAHLPGTLTVERIDPADARLAAQRRIPVVTTTSLIKRRAERDPGLYARLREAQIVNLKLLKEAGAVLAVGSDEVDDTSVAEIDHLRGLGVFTEAELLRMWTQNCARTTFPTRRIGRLEDGYEASFVVLAGDPLADFANTRRIASRFKDGQELQLRPVPAPPDRDD